MTDLDKAGQDALMKSLAADLKAANVAARKAINWPTRKACADCGTVRGKLRRACPSCAVAVCDGCWPEKHAHQVPA